MDIQTHYYSIRFRAIADYLGTPCATVYDDITGADYYPRANVYDDGMMKVISGINDIRKLKLSVLLKQDSNGHRNPVIHTEANKVIRWHGSASMLYSHAEALYGPAQKIKHNQELLAKLRDMLK